MLPVAFQPTSKQSTDKESVCNCLRMSCASQLPPLYAQENEADAMVYTKFFYALASLDVVFH